MKASKMICSVVAVGTMLTFSSCDKAKIDVNFNLEVADIYMVADTTSQFGEIELAASTFQSDLDAKLQENNASIDDVKTIKLTGAQIIMVNPGLQNFDIVDRAYGLISAGSLPETQVAYIDPVPDGATALTLTTGDVNLKDYLSQSVVNFKFKGTTNAPNMEKDSLQAKLTFRIEAEITED
jgi:hypothetical protein